MRKAIMTAAAVGASVMMALTGCGTGLVTTELTGTTQETGDDLIQEAGNGVFAAYLKRLYKNADEYKDGCPVYRNTENLVASSAELIRMYKEYCVLDYDGDGEDELLLHCGLDGGNGDEKMDPARDFTPGEMLDMYILLEADGKDTETLPGRVVFWDNRDTSGAAPVFRSNGCVAWEASEELKAKGVKYKHVAFFDTSVYEAMDLSAIPDKTYYLSYFYNDMYQRVEFDRFLAFNKDMASTYVTLSDEQYKKHLKAIEGGEVIENIDWRVFTQKGLGIADAELASQPRHEDNVFLKYLSDIYKNNDIINGYPVEIDIDEDSYEGSWTSYKKYAIGDFDGDGKDELLLQKYGPYNSGMTYMDTGFTDGIYPYFDMYELSGTGEVVDRDTEPYKIHGDLWLMGIRLDSGVCSEKFSFYDNAVFRYRTLDENGNRTEAFYIFDDDVYRQLGKLEHQLYTDYEGVEGFMLGEKCIGSAICYSVNEDGKRVRKVGSHQDGSFDVISEEDYRDEVSILTGGKELDTVFKEMRAENLRVEKREDTLSNTVYRESDAGLADVAFTGTVVVDNANSDDFGRNDPVVVLKPDMPFICVTDDDDKVRVEEIQLGVDASVRDTLDPARFEGKRVNVTGTVFSAYMSGHYRPMVLLVKECEVL